MSSTKHIDLSHFDLKQLYCMSFNIVGHKCSDNVLLNDQYQIKRDLLTKIFKKKKPIFTIRNGASIHTLDDNE